MGTLGFISSVKEGANFFYFGGLGQCNVSNVMHVTLQCGCSIPAAEWLDSSALGIV